MHDLTSATTTAIRCPACGALRAEGEPHTCALADLPVGTVVAERYQILERLGQGGMGAVYRARHVLLESAMAVKVLLRPEEEDAQGRFLMEARLASKINHLNTVTIHDFGLLEDGRPFLAMEYLDGPTLSTVIAQGRLGLERSLRIAAQIARGLRAVHEKGIIHRDLKPDNIFLLRMGSDEEFVKIVDFGIARAARRLTQSTSAAPAAAALASTMPAGPPGRLTLPGHIMGTPHYMSPEQARGEEVDARTDQYALGCILYEMLTGRVPFDHPESIVAVMLKHMNSPVPPLGETGDEKIPPSIEAIVLRLLDKLPSGRFPSMAEVDQALTAELEHLTHGRAEKRGPLLTRGRAALLVVQTLLLLLITAYLGHRALKRRGGRGGVSSAEILTLRERALKALHDDAHAPDLSVRIPAISALGESRDIGQRPRLEQFLSDASPEVRGLAAEALSRLGDRRAVPALRRAGEQASTPLLSVAIAAALFQLGEEDAGAVLSRALSESAPEARRKAAIYLCQRSNAAACRVLAELAAEPGLPDEVRAGLLAHLAQSGDGRAVERLRALLGAARSQKKQILYAARLAQAGDEKGRTFLRELAERPGPEQLPAARLLSAPDTPELAPLFRRVLEDRSATGAARLLATEGLGLAGKREDTPLLGTGLLAAGDASLRQSTALAILRLASADPALLSEQSLAFVRGALDDSSWDLRQSAATVLGDVPAASAVPLLQALLRDVEVRVRRSASRALGRRRERAALDALRVALGDIDAEVRQESLKSMGRVGQALRQRGAAPLAGELSSWVREIEERGTPKERLLASSLLLKLGDEKKRERLLAFRTAEDEEVRRLLIEQVDDASLLSGSLSDPSFPVRFAAARRLAERGDRRAVPVLREALGQNGEAALDAYALLARLGEKVQAPAALDRPLGDLSEELRLAVVSAASRLPLPKALPLLMRAARDPSTPVRLSAAEVAADLPQGAEGAPGQPVLRLLAGDGDPAVRARAQALLLSLSGASIPGEALPAPAKKEQALPARPPPAEVPAVEPVPVAAAPEPPPEKDAAAIDPLLERVRALLASGVQALERKDYRRAQKLLERASALCGKGRKSPNACAGLRPQLYFYLARSYEGQERLSEAMSDYEQVVASAGRARPEHLAEARGAMARLGERLGRILVPKEGRRGCQEVSIWMPPGRHLVNVKGRSEQVTVKVKETVKVGACP